MTTVFTEIHRLVTLRDAAAKEARNITVQDLSAIKDAALVVDGGKISWLGEQKKLPKEYRRKKTVSLKSATVTPGLVDSHTHTVFSGDRENEFELRNLGATYQEIADKGGGIISTVQKTRKATALELRTLAQARIKEFLRQGVTTLEIKSGYGLEKKTELKMLEVIKELSGPHVVSTFLGPHAVPKAISKESYFSEVKKMLNEVKKRNISNRADIFVDKGYFDLEDLKEYAECCRKLEMDLVVHADQLNRTGAAVLAADLGARSVDHVLQVSDEDISILANSKTTLVLLPTADFYLNLPYPKARQMIDKGARVALATDYNPGSSPSQSVSLVGVLARLHMKMSSAEVLVAFTLGGAYALGLENEVGSLEVGKSADFLVLKEEESKLFYEIGYSPVTSVFRKGKCIYQGT